GQRQMAPPPFVVRRFEIGEAEALRRLRLLALRDMPEAFGMGYEQDEAKPLETWQQRIAVNPPFGVFVGAEPRGLASFSRQTAANVAHRGTLGAMYVAPELRGSGAAAGLVEAVLAHASVCVEQVHLSVNADNLRASRFYRRMGFVEYGREPAGLRYAGIDHDVLLMVHMLRPAS
ncbi:MAG: GNAT family N-acetyltransferase, partial [Rhodospirillales bacterium]|nr:GNAT family N-acetyltransferase [Rhodospirillales bacterium]